MKTLKVLLICLMSGIMGAKAQVGYQIALLNTATGEARANETVTVTVSLSNNAGEVFYSETKSATTNDFGVLSLTIGNADTFKEVDLNKMPFYIEVTANGVMIGKSQMLSVPVAEVAKRLLPIQIEEIVGTWYAPAAYNHGVKKMIFNIDGYCESGHIYNGKYEKENGTYFIQNNIICINLLDQDGTIYPELFILNEGVLYGRYGKYTKIQQ